MDAPTSTRGRETYKGMKHKCGRHVNSHSEEEEQCGSLCFEKKNRVEYNLLNQTFHVVDEKKYHHNLSEDASAKINHNNEGKDDFLGLFQDRELMVSSSKNFLLYSNDTRIYRNNNQYFSFN